MVAVGFGDEGDGDALGALVRRTRVEAFREAAELCESYARARGYASTVHASGASRMMALGAADCAQALRLKAGAL